MLLLPCLHAMDFLSHVLPYSVFALPNSGLRGVEESDRSVDNSLLSAEEGVCRVIRLTLPRT